MPLAKTRPTSKSEKLIYTFGICAGCWLEAGDINSLYQLRKQAADDEYTAETKIEKRMAQRMQKACTIVIQFIEGTQKVNRYNESFWPIELVEELDCAVHTYQLSYWKDQPG